MALAFLGRVTIRLKYVHTQLLMTIAVQLQVAVAARFVDSTTIVLFDEEREQFRCDCLCRHSFLTPNFKDRPNFPMPSCQADEGEAEKNAVEFIELNNTDWKISNYVLQIGRTVDKEKF